MKVRKRLSGVLASALVLTLMFSAIAGLTPSALSDPGVVSDASTHMVLGEFATATW